MFITLVKYEVLRMLHRKEILFWSLCFPIILGTLFYFAFGSMMNDNAVFKKIPVAIVEQGTATDQKLVSVLEELSKSEEDSLFQLQKTSEAEAKTLLQEEKIEAYVRVGSDAELVVNKSGIHQSIVKEVLDKYKRVGVVIHDLAKENPNLMTNPQKIAAIATEITAGGEYTKQITLGSGKQDNTLGYFYALIAMVCIYGSLWGLDIIVNLEGNLSPLGARRNVAPTNKMKLLLADSLGAFLVHLAEISVVLMYLLYILQVDFGQQLGYILIASAFGSMIGIGMGIFCGVAVKGSVSIKTAVALAVSMSFCFLSGLMVSSMPHIIETHAPILNRINPCTLLVNCFYSLNIYNDKAVFWQNISGMAIITVLLMVGGFLLIRRRKYASI